MIRLLMQLACGAVVFLALIATVQAQAVRLTAEQQQMLDSLPSDQRQQAMQAIRDLQVSGSASSPRSINESPEPALQDPAIGTETTMLPDSEPRAASRSRLVISFERREGLSEDEARQFRDDPVLQRLSGTRFFVLDEDGILSLQGLADISLLGLTESDVERRLKAEPSLVWFEIDARILDQQPIGVEALETFGNDVFTSRNGTFDAPSTGPVPPDYVLGPGDAVRIQLFGNVNDIYEYEVTRDGILNLPEIGPITVAGISFSELRTDLNRRVEQMLIGTQVSVTMGALRTIRVFVLGDVTQPGSYVVGGMATVSSALYTSGGISDVGSLRDVQLKRDGRVVNRLDLYDLLIYGDTSGDSRLQPGDVVFVPPIGRTVSVAGAVKRPAIYEVSNDATAADVLTLAGGLANDAYAAGASIERIDHNGGRTVIALNLGQTDGRSMSVRSGDVLIVPEVLPDYFSAVSISGHVYRSGRVEWRRGLRLTDVIRSADELKPDVDLNYVLIRRQPDRGAPVSVVSADLEQALSNPASPNNLQLESRDEILVFSRQLGRQRTIMPIVDELERQATHEIPARVVHVAGQVRAPGIYPLEPGMRISDLIRAGGKLSENAYSMEAELTRYLVSVDEAREVRTQKIDLVAILNGNLSADVELAPHDYLAISRKPDWDATWTVSLQGEVRFPGDYRVKQGETLSQVVQRAGGLTDAAFAQGAVFLRRDLREREREQIDLLARRLEADLTSLSLQLGDGGGAERLATGKALLQQLRSTEAVGRLVIAPQLLHADRKSTRAADVELRDGDKLLIPPRSQVVTVIGETQHNTSHVYREDFSRDDYIDLSGGLTRRADKKLIYVVRASGEVVAGKRSRWLGRGNSTEMLPGDTIVVPLETDRIRPLTLWTNVTQILYQAAIAVAAIRTFDN